MISETRKKTVEDVLRSKGKNVTILWDTAFRNKSGNDYKVHVKCNVDGAIQIRDITSLKKGAFECQTCLNSKYTKRLDEFDFNFIGLVPMPMTNFVKLSCQHCGEERQLSVGNLMNMKEIKCHSCRLLKAISNLESKGCEFVNKIYDDSFSSASKCRIIYKDIYGVTRSASEQNVLRNNFTPSNSHWEQKHFLYVFKSVDKNYPYIKIGTANNPDRRLKDLKLDFECSVISFEYDSRYSANKTEGYCHREFKSNRLSKEITELFTKGLSKPRKDGSRIKMGCTEWFDETIFEDVIKFIKAQ